MTLPALRLEVSTAADVETLDARRAATGDETAFERLYRRHVARIHTLARRMAGPDAADDLTQDVFVRA
ncbi:MAG TPA: sigma factor, partial [Gemmatimonadales bacterium]